MSLATVGVLHLETPRLNTSVLLENRQNRRANKAEKISAAAAVAFHTPHVEERKGKKRAPHEREICIHFLGEHA